MIITYHRNFKKHFKKRILPNPNLTSKFQQRLSLFTENPSSSILLDHPLGGDYLGYRSFSIAGDIRVIYRKTETSFVFIDIGTHNQLYNE